MDDAGQTDLLQRPVPDSLSVGPDSSGGLDLAPIRSKRPTIDNFREPFRLAFTNVDAGFILRRISEYTSLQFVIDDQLLSSVSVSLDVSIGNAKQVFDIIDVLSGMAGAGVVWEGNTAVISATVADSERPVDGYLISPAPLTETTASIVALRFGVDCTPVSSFTVCLGENDQLDKADGFLRALDTARDMIAYTVVTTPHNLTAVTATLGLTDRVVVSPLGDNQFLLVANDRRHFALILEVAESLNSNSCGSTVFQPLHVDADILAAAVPAPSETDCGPAFLVDGRLLLNGTRRDLLNAKNVLTTIDQPRPLARLFILIVNRSALRELGIGLPGWQGGFPSPDLFDSVAVAATYARASGWRTIDLVTDGNSTANVTSTDRVQGNVLVTDGGSQIAGIEQRTVGLSLSIDGAVTPNGFRGRINFSDSNLDGEVTRTASCQAFVALGLSKLSRVCAYDRDDRSRSASLIDVDDSQADETLDVYVGVLAHETATLDTLRRVLK